MVKNTKMQQLAIDTIDSNLVVNAGAGTGKTKVLTERYIKILESSSLVNPKPVESIVAITFTKKASKEMIYRIRQELRKKAEESDYWYSIYKDMDKANISTIHSFCNEIIKENFLHLGISPKYEIIEENRKDILLDKIAREVFNREINRNEDLRNLVFEFSNISLDRFLSDLIKLYDQIRSNGYFLEEVYDLTMSNLRELDLDCKIDLDREIVEDFIYLMENTSKNSKFNKLAKMPEWEKYLNKDYDNKIEVLDVIKEQIGQSKPNQEIIDRLKSNIEKLYIQEDLKNIWKYDLVFKLLDKIDKSYSKKKRELEALDYSDLEFLAYRVLRENKDIRFYYQNKYKYFMVDEFQDTNKLQKEIFYLLVSKDSLLDRNNFFIVGDPKQAIYGFRGGDLDIFEEVSQDIKEKSGGKEIYLDKNFRSKDKIIDFVNTLFSKVMGNFYIDLQATLSSEDDFLIEVIEDKDLAKDIKNTDYEAYCIASHIEKLVGSKEYKYKDIALLFRSISNISTYEKYLKKFKIPFYNTDSENILERQEVIDLINGLKFISNKNDKLALMSLLRSPLFGLKDESLYFISKYDSDLEKLENHLSKEDYGLYVNFLELYKDLKSMLGIYSIKDICLSLVERTAYMEVLSLDKDFKQKISNVNKFLDLIDSYESKNIDSLQSFIDELEYYRKNNLVINSADISTDRDNVVKIMTIHKSKGLQFPVVIVPELSKSTYRDNSILIFNKDLGLGFNYSNSRSGYYEKVKSENNSRELEEEKRVFYVALTRAKEKLILGNQGRKTGFKKLLDSIGSYENIKNIKYDYQEEEEASYSSINFNNTIDFKIKDLPSYVEFDWHKNKNFNSINPSQFIEFNYCKRRFYYNYYKPLPEFSLEDSLNEKDRKLPGNIKGNIVHKFCELYTSSLNKDRLLGEIVESYSFSYTDNIRKELDPYIDNYLDFYNKWGSTEFLNEQLFYLKLKDIYINGIIDRVYIKDNKVYIYDFKTNKLENKSRLIDYYEAQLQIYALAMSKLCDYEISNSSILFLENGECVNVDISKSSLDRRFEELEEFLDFIRRFGRLEDYRKRLDCDRNCPYESLCFK